MTDASDARTLALLQGLAAEIEKAPEAKAAAQTIVRAGRALLESVSSTLWLVDAEGALDLVASDGVPDSFLDQWRRVLPTDDVPAMHAVHRGKPLWVSSSESYRDVADDIADRARAANRPMAFAAVPLRFEERNLGVLVFGFPEPHPFTDAHKAVVLAVASHAAQALERARLHSARLRTLAGLRVIAKVGEMVTTASLDIDATLTALARAVVPDVADWCVVDMFDEGDIRRLTAHHIDPAKVALVRDYAARYPSRMGGPDTSLSRVLEKGETVWMRRITPEILAAAVHDSERLERLFALGLRSIVRVPLLSEGAVRGMVTFIMAESGREYDETDRDLLEEIARHAGHALTNASLYAREQRARERAARLANVTAELARASTAANVGEVACREGAAALGATSAALYALDSDRLRLLARFAPSETEAEAKPFHELPLSADLPLTRVVRTREPVVVTSRDDLRREFPSISEETIAERPELAMICNPLADGAGRVVGALAFAFVGARTFPDDERAFARALADHCAQAFDRARLLDSERAARDRLTLLATVGEALSATIDYDTTLTAVVRTALPLLGDFAFFDVVEEDGEVRRTACAHDDPEVGAILDASRWQRSDRKDINLCALSSGESAIHSRIDDVFLKDMASSEEHLAVLRRLQLCSMVTVPVVVRSALIGALTLCHGRSGRHHSSDDLELARELARRGALAVDQARLYRSATEAARRAEAANRIKDDFLATLSHELRTPLNSILGWSQLLDDDARLDDRAFVVRGLDVIRRNARAQRAIVEDMLDVARIVTGKLRLDLAPLDLAEVVRDAIDVVRPAAEGKAVMIETRGIEKAIHYRGDRARLQQIVWNLLSNAVKFTPARGRVEVDAEVRDAAIVVRVRDDGSGIEPHVLPFVFDRFRQGDSSSTRPHGGLGLGLSIVRHLVELHGGTVAAKSEGRGKGAELEVVLPVSPVATAHAVPRVPESKPGLLHASLSGTRVLVVDDTCDSSELVVVILETAGATVRCSTSADEAVALFDREPFDAVIIDIAAPGVDGYALLGMLEQRATQLRRPLRAIALTAPTRREDGKDAKRAGFAAHLSKPLDPQAVVASVARAIDDRRSR